MLRSAFTDLATKYGPIKQFWFDHGDGLFMDVSTTTVCCHAVVSTQIVAVAANSSSRRTSPTPSSSDASGIWSARRAALFGMGCLSGTRRSRKTCRAPASRLPSTTLASVAAPSPRLVRLTRRIGERSNATHRSARAAGFGTMVEPHAATRATASTRTTCNVSGWERA